MKKKMGLDRRGTGMHVFLVFKIMYGGISGILLGSYL